ncbi:ammonium transporter [Magnetospira sp. QH-2]|uniref:ammonium transporter n=1 Tax=Magnetospira sp. (strain QH-2) TaxID=1288970 RepID=UPI0003E81249|nr:ammonium transporter [Magnetospira sp. QH-2]CCQ73494.1 Ammonium transport protein (Amt family) [Magnetospira sp. QH-2]
MSAYLKSLRWALPAGLGGILLPAAAQAADGIDTGHTAWIITATALVLFMTLPGLALFYAGLVRARNTLSVLMHCFAVACISSVLWVLIGYSMAFGEVGGGIIGGMNKLFLSGVTVDSASGEIPEVVFMMFQMTFAIITPALILGAFVERAKFTTTIAFSGLWMLLVYAPAVHWIWGGGLMTDDGLFGQWFGVGVKDFAGGIVVHATAGAAALVAAVVIGPRKGFPNHLHPPHSPGLTMMGAAMLWVGWFGFNGGSALAANGGAGMAIAVTHLSAAVASLTWMALEWKQYGKPTLVGIVTGMVAGLATVTPASGFIGPLGGLVCGLGGGALCYVAVNTVKMKWHIDDSLDVFAVHGVGGILGSILVAFFALPSLGGLGLGDGVSVGSQLTSQIAGIVIAVIWSGLITFLIFKVLAGVFGLRVDPEEENEGVDLTEYGERAYDFN